MALLWADCALEYRRVLLSMPAEGLCNDIWRSDERDVIRERQTEGSLACGIRRCTCVWVVNENGGMHG